MAVAFDANASSPVHTAGATSLSLTTFTMGSVSNGALVSQLFTALDVSSIVANWDSGGTPQSMTSIITAASASTHRVAMNGLVAPTSGNKTLAVSWTTSSEAYLNATSWSGVNQTGGSTTFAHTGTATAFGQPTLTITSAVGNATLAITVIDASNNVSITQTDVINSVGTALQAMGTRGTGAATVAHTWDGDSNTWVVIGVDIVAAATATFIARQNLPSRQPMIRASSY